MGDYHLAGGDTGIVGPVVWARPTWSCAGVLARTAGTYGVSAPDSGHRRGPPPDRHRPLGPIRRGIRPDDALRSVACPLLLSRGGGQATPNHASHPLLPSEYTVTEKLFSTRAVPADVPCRRRCRGRRLAHRRRALLAALPAHAAPARSGRSGRGDASDQAHAPGGHRRLGRDARRRTGRQALLPGRASRRRASTPTCLASATVTNLTATQVAAQRGKAQISAPMLSFDEEDDIYMTLTNLGLAQRPDLFDGHTLHWHGFVNAIPLFDGVPELSLAVPVGRDLTYFYRPHDARHLYVSLPLRGRGARPDGHDGHGVRPAPSRTTRR